MTSDLNFNHVFRSHAPFKVGDEVRVIRARHGWHDGRLLATITARHQRLTGTWSYDAVTVDGDYIEIKHTRDAYLA